MNDISSILESYKTQLKNLQCDPSFLALERGTRARIIEDMSRAITALALAEDELLNNRGEQERVSSSKQKLWERKLLDLSLRNNLLNMKEGKRAALTDVSSISTFEDNMHEGGEMQWNELFSHLPEKERIKVAQDLAREAKISIEENGACTLFATLGTLHWVEESPQQKQRMAPILLMPIEITRTGKDKYVIRKRDEETVLNETLIEYLRQIIGIDVPVLSPLPKDDHGVDVDLILHTFSAAIEDKKGWIVSEDAYIGTFSFTKFVMWNDIRTHSDLLSSHPVLKSLIEGRLVASEMLEPSDATLLDQNCAPGEHLLPLEYDSSQLEAVVDSLSGHSFILFGPPGTGKSQTIANIIANALYHDKRVLFVAEKKAALDVVYKRLGDVGLSPVCLELHSNKTSKQYFLDQIQNALDFSVAFDGNPFKKLAEVLGMQRKKFLDYQKSIHKKGSHGLSLSDCIAKILVTDKQEVKLAPGWTNSKTSKNIQEIYDLCISLDENTMQLGAPLNQFPLHDLIPRKYDDSSIRDLKLAIRGIPSLLKDAESKAAVFKGKSALQIVKSESKWSRLMQLAEISKDVQKDFDSLKTAAKGWVESINLLPQWISFLKPLDDLRRKGLGDLVDMYLRGIPGKDVADAFMKGFCMQVSSDIIEKDSELKTFNSLAFDRLAETYKKQDTEFRTLAQQAIKAKKSSRIPKDSREVLIGNELTLLKKRIGNKGRGASIRDMINQMPELLPRICPCMLMSPLSVAQFLPLSENCLFDLVIFDEASQMPTSEAIGAIARGKAVIVVGDPKQMPPTNFFNAEVIDEDEADFDDLESVLDDFISLSFPKRELKWHYRSDHESLINFSNQNYYGGKLITFPTPDDKTSHVTFQHVDGYYDFGKTRCNSAEAKAIVEEVINRLKAGDTRSIGIVAFSKAQSDYIEDLLNSRFAEIQDIDLMLAKIGEPIFVKNLENVQGDERDVILFSVGYGPDETGHVSMNFGPLNKIGGERRLNVAVSRARCEMKVFSTLNPEQIDERRTDAEGVIGLKRFLEFAKTGITTHRTEISSARQAMSRQVCEALQAKGIKAVPCVGTSDFRIDIAIEDANDPMKYQAGVILDAVTGNGLKTIRDREIVRPRQLKRYGWNILHVWAVDWLVHPDIVINQLCQLISI